MDAQEIFDTVCRHMHQQGRRSAVGSSCKYRCDNGDKCAAGALMTDDEYRPEMEGVRFGLDSDIPWPERLEKHGTLIRQLQYAHDRASSDFWSDARSAMSGIARQFKLSTTVLDSLP